MELKKKMICSDLEFDVHDCIRIRIYCIYCVKPGVKSMVAIVCYALYKKVVTLVL